jgi:acyl transferase domain-containing protein
VVIPAHTAFDLVSTLNGTSLIPTRETESPRIGYVFTGQGAQWHAMGRELLEQYPVFAATLNAADAYLFKLGAPFSLLGMFFMF